jgi:cytochrome c2
MFSIKKIFPIAGYISFMTVVFVYGVLVGKYQLYPYGYFVNIKSIVSPSLDNIQVKDNVFQTSHNKLKSKTINYWNSSNLVGNGGAFTIFRDEILGVDKEGHFFKINNDQVELLPTIFLESNESFVLDLMKKSKISETLIPKSFRNFRFLDILALDNNSFLVSYHYFNKEKQTRSTRVSKVNVDQHYSMINSILLYESKFKINFSSDPGSPFYSNRSGGKMEIFDNNQILLSIGDNQYDELYNDQTSPQKMNSDFGKLLLINLKNKDYKIVAKGLRNPQGLLVTEENEIYELEHGPQGGDELNFIEFGENYGWPIVTYGVDYGTNKWPLQDKIGRHSKYKKPIYTWIPSIAPSSIIQVSNIENWEGDFVFGTLKDKSIYRVRIENERVVFIEKIFINERVRDLIEFKNKVYLWTDNARILILSSNTYNSVDYNFSEEEKIAGVDYIFKQCLVCHQQGTNKNQDRLPSLNNIIGNNIASSGYKNYSNSLKELSGTKWDTLNLDLFLKNPDEFAPGTSMNDFKLEDEFIRKSIINFMGKIKN